MPGTDEDKNKLKGAFGEKGTQANAISYGHPYADTLVEQARVILLESAEGKNLVKVLDSRKVPVHVLKGKDVGGFSPEMMTIFIQTPSNLSSPNALFIVDLIKGLREAAQEIGGFKAPDPMKDVIAYAEFIHSRNMDSLVTVCKVTKELTNSAIYTDLLDTLTDLGLNGVYKAYIGGGSDEDLFMEYAAAFKSE